MQEQRFLVELSLLGQKMLRLTGVREILRDIEQTMAQGEQGYINLSAGNPLVIPELQDMWHGISSRMPAAVFGEVVGRYGSSQGYAPFVQALLEAIRTQYGWNVTEKNVLVTAGSQSLFFYLVNIFSGAYPGGEKRKVLLPLTPEYTGYDGVTLSDNAMQTVQPLIEKIGAHEFRYKVNFDQLHLDKSIAALLVSRPGNPTGCVLLDEEMQHLARLAQSHRIPLIVDSAYGPPFPNLAYVDMQPVFNEYIVHAMSFSKTGLPGERLGVAIAHESIIQAISGFLTNASIHASRFGQTLAAAAIGEGSLEAVCRDVVKPMYQAKARLLQRELAAQLQDLPWRLHRIEGGLFGWLWFEGLAVSDRELYRRLKEEKVFVVPGSYFFVGHNESWRHKQECIRISLTVADDQLVEGIHRLGKVVRALY